MKYVIVVILLTLVTTSTKVLGQEVSPKPPVLALLTEDNPPHSYQNPETGVIEGISVDIVTSLMQRAGLTFTLEILPWNRAFRRGQSQQNTCVFPTNRTPSREHMFQWVSPTQIGGWAIYQRQDTDFQVKQLEDIKTFDVVGKIGSPASQEIEDTIGKPIMRAASDEAAALLLYRGRADLWVAGVLNGPSAADAAGLPEPKMAFNWKPAFFGVACSLSTDKRLIKLLGQANQDRIAEMEIAGKPLSSHVTD